MTRSTVDAWQASRPASTVPILAGTPNPGTVSVALLARPLTPASDGSPLGNSSMDLEVVASDSTAAARVVALLKTNQGALVSFNKPINPAAAADVRNYAVRQVDHTEHTDLFWSMHTRSSVDPVRLRAARYDPARRSVPLVPRRPGELRMNFMTAATQVHAAGTSARAGSRSTVGPGLADLQGTPIDATTSPGKVEVRLKGAIGAKSQGDRV